MIARLWRGWTAAESADEVARHLRSVTLARHEVTPGNLSTLLLRRPSAGGVELLTLSLWERDAAVPPAADEEHRLLVARQTLPSRWEIVDPPRTLVPARPVSRLRSERRDQGLGDHLQRPA